MTKIGEEAVRKQNMQSICRGNLRLCALHVKRVLLKGVVKNLSFRTRMTIVDRPFGKMNSRWYAEPKL